MPKIAVGIYLLLGFKNARRGKSGTREIEISQLRLAVGHTNREGARLLNLEILGLPGGPGNRDIAP